MNDLLTNILHMSLTGSIVIIVVMLSRLVMRRLPKKYMYMLWGIVGFRLLCPVTFESRFSIFNITPIRNSVENVRDIPIIQYGSGHIADTANAAAHYAQNAAGAAQMHFNIVPIILISVWAAVAAGIVLYIVYKYLVIKHDLRNTTELKPGLYVGHQVDSPFVLGIIKPKIYMPAGLTDSEMEYLTLHEKTHIRRGDTFFKALGILTVALHWFNPLVWAAYVMFVRDMEMSCDEEVIARLGSDVKADYSMSLVSFAQRSNDSRYIVVPVAFSKALFGRKDVKMRIKNVLGYHGTSKLISTMALVLVASVSLVCLFNATSRADDEEIGLDATSETTAAAEPTSNESATVITSDTDENDVEIILDDGNDIAGTDGDLSAQEPANVPEDGTAVTISSDSDDASYEENTDNIFKTALPVFKSIPYDVVLNLPKGSTIEKNPELDGYLIPGVALESDAFSVYYNKGVSVDDFNKFVEVLKTQYGFNKDAEFSGPTTFSATNADGLSVTVEVLGNDYMRISYYNLVDGVNTFSRLG